MLAKISVLTGSLGSCFVSDINHSLDYCQEDNKTGAKGDNSRLVQLSRIVDDTKIVTFDSLHQLAFVDTFILAFCSLFGDDMEEPISLGLRMSSVRMVSCRYSSFIFMYVAMVILYFDSLRVFIEYFLTGSFDQWMRP